MRPSSVRPNDGVKVPSTDPGQGAFTASPEGRTFGRGSAPTLRPAWSGVKDGDGGEVSPQHGAVERRAPAFLPVPGQLEVVALARHADHDAPDAQPAAEEGADPATTGAGPAGVYRHGEGGGGGGRQISLDYLVGPRQH
jgi:hypothetical protein